MGLRAQIVLSLLAVFLVSFALLGLAAVHLTQRAAEVERARLSRVVAQGIAREIERADAPLDQAFERALEGHVALVPVSAGALDVGSTHLTWGRVPDAAPTRLPLRGGGELRVWLPPPDTRAGPPLANLLLFYVVLTGVAVLLFAYLALTRLIVRPMDRLTHSSERLAAGASDVSVPLTGAAEVVRLAVAFNAMASQLRAEREALESRLAELERTATELRTTEQQLVHGEKLASVGRLAAGIAHEIGNPLAAILGMLELLQAGELSRSEADEFLSRISRETERINGIIRNLLDFSRPDREGELLGTADVEQAVRDAVGLVRPQKAASELEIQVCVAPGLGRVLGSQHRLTQVLLNLVLNAVDALSGRGRVEVGASRDVDGQQVLITVQDDGPGIPEEMLGHLFEPFTTTKAVGEGTGLGLAVCHALVEGLGGSIAAHNRESGGARFEIRLPRATQTDVA